MTADEIQQYNRAWLECIPNLNDACRVEPAVGDELMIPALDGTTLIPRGSIYVIKRGDRLFRIGTRSGHTVTELQMANPDVLRDPHNLKVGVSIVIPTGSVDVEACTGESNPALQRGDQGKICLSVGKDLGLRDTPGTGNTIERLKNGTTFTVIDGPHCAYYSYANKTYPWWKVQIDSGTTGWVVDGGDTKGDPVYLCRL